MTITEPTILIVDDSTNDILLMRTVFRRVGLERPLQFAVGGEDAIAYLRGDGRYRDRAQFPLPTVVLMDLNMPGRSGFEILEWIHRQHAFKRLRVYILSASSRTEDIERAYDLGAGSYLVKPRNLDGLVRMAKALLAWLKVSHFAPLQEMGESRDPSAVRDASTSLEDAAIRRTG